ncbi:hypothetical protein MTO96_024788 [Rhipicephalus appendiculatus]
MFSLVVLFFSLSNKANEGLTGDEILPPFSKGRLPTCSSLLSVALVNEYGQILDPHINPRTYTGFVCCKSSGTQDIEKIVEIQL